MENDENAEGDRRVADDAARRQGAGIRHGLPAGLGGRALPASQRSLDEGGEKALEEERRLAYVGITRARRARDHLPPPPTGASTATGPASIPSRFLDELPPEQVQREGSAGMARSRVARHAERLHRQPAGCARAAARVIEAGAWEVRERPRAGRAPSRSATRLPPEVRLWHASPAVDDDRLDIEFEKAGPKRVLDSFVETARDAARTGPRRCPAAAPSRWRRWRSRACRRTRVPAFEAALQTVCATVGYFRDEATDTWRVEGVREAGARRRGTGRRAGPRRRWSPASSRRRCRPRRSRPRAGWPAPSRASPSSRSAAASWCARPMCRTRVDLWPHRAAAGCRPRLRQRRACLDPRLPDGLRARGAPPAAAAHPGPRHRLRHPGAWPRRSGCAGRCWRPTSSPGRCASPRRMRG